MFAFKNFIFNIRDYELIRKMYSQYLRKQMQKHILSLEWLCLTCKAMVHSIGVDLLYPINKPND
jgi:hypothetical protein